MKPNRKELIPAPVSLKTSSVGTTATTSVAHDVRKQDEQLQNLCENVVIIGWLSIIASTTMLLCAGLTMQWSNEVVRSLMLALRKSVETERTRMMFRRVVMAVSLSAYFLSAVNVLMNLFLLFGVNKLNYKLMLPWLLFHGVLFGFCAHLAIYMTITSLLVDFKAFVVLLASFTMIILVFYKISFEVFHLCKTLRKDGLTKDQSVKSGMENQANFLVLQSEA
ncbi:uncharacterized protein LOC101463212 [Ceratitis capitata]|uniref:uncharacterized protein LOC101463212 n=1 Tax=Ceratitis capitata TaxID=7213 RepID=UPI000329CC1E|nr:uncharacterized protein LOC101463212 [Ceratitis capitata]